MSSHSVSSEAVVITVLLWAVIEVVALAFNLQLGGPVFRCIAAILLGKVILSSGQETTSSDDIEESETSTATRDDRNLEGAIEYYYGLSDADSSVNDDRDKRDHDEDVESTSPRDDSSTGLSDEAWRRRQDQGADEQYRGPGRY